jgi:hypothetical protein
VAEPLHPAGMKPHHPCVQQSRGMTLGPLQVLVVNFDDADRAGEIEAELHRLDDAGIVRALDVLVVAKSPDGDVEVLRSGERHSGELSHTLLGLDAEPAEVSDDEWAVADAIRPGAAAAIALLEHRWAVPLQEAIERAGGHGVVAEWADADDLASIGVTLAS